MDIQKFLALEEIKGVHYMRQAIYKGRKIKTVAELPANAAYYNDIYEDINANAFYSFTRIYDNDFKPLEDVHIIYTNLLKDLTRIAEAQQVEKDPIFLAYSLENLHNGFYKVEENENTRAGLIAACDSLVEGKKF